MRFESEDAFKEYRKTVMAKAENLIKHEFPRRTMELDELLRSPMFSSNCNEDTDKTSNGQVPAATDTELSTLSSDEQSPSASTPPLEIPCNDSVKQMIAVIRPKLIELQKDTNELKSWMVLLCPKMEDGNNFGVSVQEAMHDEVVGVPSMIKDEIANLKYYHIERACVIKKMLKHPAVDDFKQAVTELDVEMAVKLRCSLQFAKKSYSMLHNDLLKNWEKIVRPRGEDQEDTAISSQCMAYYG